MPPEQANGNALQHAQGGPRFIEDSYIVAFQPRNGVEHPLIERPNPANRGRVPFGETTTGQSRAALANSLGIRGEVVKILDELNAAHIRMDAREAERLSHDPRIARIEQDQWMSLAGGTVQENPGWGLDRLDEATPKLDNQYHYYGDGAGQTVYVLDSGLNIGNINVANEFDGRASVIYDVNGGSGTDCYNNYRGHGTPVSSIIGGETRGVAKGVTIKMAKVTDGCTENVATSTLVYAFNWLSANESPGTIVNYSLAMQHREPFTYCDIPILSGELEFAIQKAFYRGIIIVVAAGNDGCNVVDFTPTRIPEAFVVGATTRALLDQGKDAKWSDSRSGWNIATFSPGEYVGVIDGNGFPTSASGTSFAAPYMTGIFASACQGVYPFCESGDTFSIYHFMRNTGTLGTVTEADGSPLSGSPSRFIRQQW